MPIPPQDYYKPPGSALSELPQARLKARLKVP